jgi:O-acetyl-ADP-ribose deacetylase (regulator of RNase III)
MKNILIVDLNPRIIEAASNAGLDFIHADYFSIAYRTPHSVLMTASNPNWTFGGGIDYDFTRHFPKLCEFKRIVGGDMERIGNICFTITVDETLKATPEQVEKAIRFAHSTLLEGEKLLVHGAGTGIGGMSPEEFVRIIKNI